MIEKNREEVFKEQWIEEVCRRLRIYKDTPSYFKVLDIYNNNRKNTMLRIRNSFNYKETSYTAEQFFLEAGKSFTLNENGVLFVQKHVQESLLSVFNVQGIELRQIFKRLKIDFFASGDSLLGEYYKKIELCKKIIINGLYGLNGSRTGAFFNIDCADTTTAAGRNMIAIANLTNEMQNGGYRPYILDAHLKLIDTNKKQAEEMVGRFTLPEVDTETVLKHVLLYHYDNYPYISFLRQIISEMSPWERSVLYLKNNIPAYFRVPEVREKIKRWLDCNRIELMVDKKPSKFSYSDLTDQIRKDYIDLCFGFFYYEGDYVNGLHCETMVDIFSAIQRKVTVGGDTDSGISTVMVAVDEFESAFREDIGDLHKEPLFLSGAVPVLFSEFIAWSSRKVLWDYCENLGVDKEDIPRIDLECEHVMEQLHPTILKKNYIMRDTIKDYLVDKGQDIKYVGLKLTKSDANKGMSEFAEESINNVIFPKMEEFSFAKMINHVYDTTQAALKVFQDDDFVLNKKTILKVKEDASFGDARMKCIRLWNRIYPNDMIEIPGSFGVVPIQLYPESLDWMRENRPDWFNIILNHCTELTKYKMINSITTRVYSLAGAKEEEDMEEDMEEDDFEEEEGTPKKKKTSPAEALAKYMPFIEQLSADGRQRFRDVCRMILRKVNPKEYQPEAYPMLQEIMSRFDAHDFALVRKIIPYKETINVTDANICRLIDRIAVPVDINTIPEFLRIPDIIDLTGACEFEQLVGPLVNTCSVRVIRNKKKMTVVTSILKTF